MPQSTSALTFQLLQWLAERPRTYVEAMDAWRSNCPRLSIWDDAMIAGLIRVNPGVTRDVSLVSVTSLGSALIKARST